jgi:FMN phosphatase YigB (HAD superfamily)
MRANEISPKKLVVFDIDDTLVHTQTKVHVVKDGEVINSLNSHDFTHYKLKPGESFDFEDFRNAREFFEKSKPIIPMMQQLRQDIATGNKVVMVTARADFDDKELFLDTFRKYGIDMSKVHVYRAGNSKEGTTEDRKKAIIKRLLDQDNYSKAIMYDDAKPNLHTFIELKKDHPRTRFYAWHVSLEGKASEYMREGLVAERKRKRKSRWAAYGPGPFGGYGYAAGYSGVGGVGSAGDGGGGVGEASYTGNIGAMEMAKFFQKATDQQKKILKDLIASGKRGLAWKLIQDVTGVKLQGAEFQIDADRAV